MRGFERRLAGTRAARGNDGLMAKVLRSAEAVAQAQVAMALTQGYRPRAPRQTRRACRIDGTDAPVDLVVLA
jgi:hypothetical protein